MILGSLDHLSAVLVGELPRLFERVAFVHGVHPVEGGSSDYEVGGGGHGVLLRDSFPFVENKISQNVSFSQELFSQNVSNGR